MTRDEMAVAAQQRAERAEGRLREISDLLEDAGVPGGTTVYGGVLMLRERAEKAEAALSRPAPPDDLEDVAMAARRGLAFGHQATPQTPERMIERKEQALGQILDICERHGVSSSVLRAPAPVAAPAPETPTPDAMPAPFSPPMGVCQWLDDGGDYATECGHGWQFIDGDVTLNDAKFCLFCGGKIQVIGAEAQP